jgi:CTP-dependent riboflavin kinase
MDVNLLVTLEGINNHVSMDQIAYMIGKSKSYVSILCKELEDSGYVDNPYVKGGPRRAVARKVTEKGLQVLRDEHLIR